MDLSGNLRNKKEALGRMAQVGAEQSESSEEAAEPAKQRKGEADGAWGPAQVEPQRPRTCGEAWI